jgi:hypothetical protein
MLDAASGLFRTHKGAALVSALLAGWIAGLDRRS